MNAALGTMQWTTPWPGAIALLIWATAAAVCLARRSFGRRTVLAIVGGLLLALAAFTPMWRLPDGPVLVMVDLSPSTRGADFRHRALLDQLIQKILGNRRRTVVAFGGKMSALPTGNVLPDLPADETDFTPPPGEPVLLFSDGQFKAPAVMPRVYPVIDPQLSNVDDSAVASLEIRGPLAVADIRHHGRPRSATWDTAGRRATFHIDRSTISSTRPAPLGDTSLSLDPADRWPENDRLSVRPPAPGPSLRVWIGPRDPGPGWLHLLPSQCTTDPANYAAVVLIVVDDVSADALSTSQQVAIRHFVDDFGGGLVLLGGGHAFSGAAWDRSPLGVISPLSSSPPRPQRRWIVVLDASGSMADPSSAGGTLFDAECAAARGAVATLPPPDAVTVGSFARVWQPWVSATAAEATRVAFPPVSVRPNGPTALSSALASALVPGDGPTTLLLMTDADTDPIDIDAIQRDCAAAHAAVHVLLLGQGRAAESLKRLASLTHGHATEQYASAQWADAARALLRPALPDRSRHSTVVITFEGDLAARVPQPVNRWNTTWLKASTAPLARGAGHVLGAHWKSGAGMVTAFAFPQQPDEVTTLPPALMPAPHDPRFTTTWSTPNGRPTVTVTAVERDHFLNEQSLQLIVSDVEQDVPQPQIPMLQIAPGTYTATLASSPRTREVSVRLAGKLIDRRALAGRYPPEFDRLGNDLENLNAIAEQSGGEVVLPQGPMPSIFGSSKSIVLTTPLLAAALAAIAIGLWFGR